MTTKFATLVSEDKPENQSVASISFVDEDGKATDIGGTAPDLSDYATKDDLADYAKSTEVPPAYSLPAASAAAAGGVKQAAAVAAPAADADAAALSTTLGAVIKAMQDAGQMAKPAA